METRQDKRQSSAVQTPNQTRDCGWKTQSRCALGDAEQHPEASWTERAGDTMRYLVILERGENSFGAYVPDLPGCAVVAETREEALRLIREAIAFHVESLREDGSSVPEPVSTTEFVQV
jgi:predicted RNase H-like HicB family nuclease